jgi:transcriptional regulator with XRE-family HTH domain
MKNTLNFEIGNRVRKQREFLGYTREELAEKIDISTRFLTEIEYGSKGMSTSTLIKMCDILHVTTDYILLGREEYTDNSRIIDMFKNVDEKYIPCAEELLKVFIKSTNV